MRFWESSAIIPLLVHEATSRQMQRLADEDSRMVVWWGSEVECASALSRRQRSGVLDHQQITSAQSRLKKFATIWLEIEPEELVRSTAIRFLRVHALRAGEALQLAAAFVGADGRPDSLPFVTLDARLAEAAASEGFQLVGI